MDAYMRGKDSNCNEATSNMALSLISSLTPATVINLCSAENFALTTHNELIGTNSVDLNPATSLSDDSGVPLTTNSSISSGDSYRLGMCRFEMELVESDGEVSQLDSLDNCSEGGMSAENFNTLKKGPLAPIEPPPEFQDSPHTTLGRCVPKNILNNLTRWSSSHSLFEKTNDSENDEGKLNKGDNAMMSRSTMQSNIKEQLYSSDIILNTHIDNIYDEPSDIVSFGRNIRIDSDSKPTAAPAKTYCPHYKDHTRYFRAIPSEHDGNLTCMSLHKMNGHSEIHDYDMYYDFKRNFFNANQFDSTIQMKVVCSPLNHHYHTGGSSFNRPNSRNSLNSRLSSSHNSLNVPSSNKPDDSIFITQAMSHDALLTREISDFYNVPIDSDIYAFPIDMIQADQEKTDDLNKTKENDSKPDKSIRQKCFRSNKRRKRSSNNLLNNNCTDEHLFGIDRKLNKPKHSYKAVALALAWDGSGNKQTVMSNGQIEPLEMTIDGVKNFYHTYYSGPKEPESVRKAIVGGSSAMGSPTKLTDIFPMKVKCADEMVLTLTEKEKFTKNQSPVVPMKVNNTMDIKNIKVVDKNDNVNNNTADSNHLHNSINHQEQQSNHRVQQNNSNNKLTLQSEKKSQFTLNLKQKFCSIFRFRKGQSRCQGNSTHSADYISGRDRKTNHIQYVDNKCKKFQSRALPPLPNKPCTETMSFELDGKVNKKQDLRAFHFTSSIEKVKDYGWYWGPLSSEAAEKVLSNEPDGSFIVRDSSDHHYIFSLSFKLNNCVRHVRIEQDQGTFSFGSYAKFKSQTITEFIEKAVEHSRSGRYLFFLHRRPEHGPMRVQLTNPVSRFKHIQSLQHMCRFIILKAVIRKDLIQTLPLPRRLLDYLSYKHCYSEQVESDGSQSQMSEDGQV